MAFGEIIKLILAALGGLIVVQEFLAKFFGITMLGKRITKGAPTWWRAMMSRAAFRKEVMDKLTEIKAELDYNGGNSIKDAVMRIDATVTAQIGVLKMLKASTDLNALRHSLNDESNDRMIFKVNNEGKCIFINTSFLRFFGYTEKDMLGWNWESIVDSKDIDSVRDKWKRAIEKKSNYYSEHGLCDSDGKCWQCIVRAYPLLDVDKGELQEFYGTVDVKDFQIPLK